jgi:transcription elongation factor GreA
MKDRIHYLTPEGLAKVRQELEHLTQVKRREIAERLEFAIKQGDISENADYEVAKQDQAFNEGKISELEDIVLRAEIIKKKPVTGEVQVGSQVTVQEDGYPPETYTIVGPTEAEPANGRISHESPVGAALLGKRVGDMAKIATPNGELQLKVTEIA